MIEDHAAATASFNNTWTGLEKSEIGPEPAIPYEDTYRVMMYLENTTKMVVEVVAF